MTSNLAQTGRDLRRSARTFSVSLFGLRWSLSLRPCGTALDGQPTNLPDTVGTDGLISLPRPVQLTFDYTHLYMTGAENRPATCRIRVYSPMNVILRDIHEVVPGLIHPTSYSPQSPTVVLCEPIAIGGITNRAEEIATAVWHQLGRPTQLTWIEHWWKSSTPDFRCVSFRCNAQGVLVDPTWTNLLDSEVELLIGRVEEISRE